MIRAALAALLSRLHAKGRSALPEIVAPPVTERMRLQGNIWRRIESEWFEVCGTCGGNCGQCGTSVAMGIPASLDTIIYTTGMHNGNVAGLPRRI